MALTQEIYPYEILLRFGDAADSKGKLTGASYQTITRIMNEGALFAERPDELQQLALVDTETGQLLNDVLGEVNAATIIQNQTLTSDLSTAQAEVQTLTQQLATAQAEIQRLNNLLAEAI